MSQSYNDFNGFANPTPGTETWFNNQFISTPDSGPISCPDPLVPHQKLQQNQYDGLYTNAKLTPSNNIKSEVGNSGYLNDNGMYNNGQNMDHNNDTAQFNQFIANNGIPGVPNLTSSFSNSSDKSSSPSTNLNNAVVTLNDLNFLNDESKDEKDMTEKEIADRRKAQNRAAQRAFRERKEMKLKELEDKLNKSEFDRENLLKQLEDLKKQNVVISTENKLLLQNGNTITPLQINNSSGTSISDSLFSFPSGHYQDFTSIPKQQREKTLTINEVWEYLNDKNDPSLDLSSIMNEIEGLEVCHEHGASYPISIVDKIVFQHKLKRKRN